MGCNLTLFGYSRAEKPILKTVFEISLKFDISHYKTEELLCIFETHNYLNESFFNSLQ